MVIKSKVESHLGKLHSHSVLQLYISLSALSMKWAQECLPHVGEEGTPDYSQLEIGLSCYDHHFGPSLGISGTGLPYNILTLWQDFG